MVPFSEAAEARDLSRQTATLFGETTKEVFDKLSSDGETANEGSSESSDGKAGDPEPDNKEETPDQNIEDNNSGTVNEISDDTAKLEGDPEFLDSIEEELTTFDEGIVPLAGTVTYAGQIKTYLELQTAIQWADANTPEGTTIIFGIYDSFDFPDSLPVPYNRSAVFKSGDAGTYTLGWAGGDGSTSTWGGTNRHFTAWGQDENNEGPYTVTFGSGLTFDGYNSVTDVYGGGVFLPDSCKNYTLILDGASFTNCRTSQKGGAFAVDEGNTTSEIQLKSGSISNCVTTSFGGAIYLSNGLLTIGDSAGSGNPSITNCTSQSHGGAVALGPGAETAFYSGTISDSSALYYGGGIFLVGGSKLTMSGGTISGSSSQAGGGIAAGEGAKVTFSGGTITNCRAEGTGWWRGLGGGIFLEVDSELTMVGTALNRPQITNCSATDPQGAWGHDTTPGSGGGIYVACLDASNKVSNVGANIKVNLKYATISGCSAKWSGGGIFTVYPPNLTIDKDTVDFIGNSAYTYRIPSDDVMTSITAGIPKYPCVQSNSVSPTSTQLLNRISPLNNYDISYYSSASVYDANGGASSVPNTKAYFVTEVTYADLTTGVTDTVKARTDVDVSGNKIDYEKAPIPFRGGSLRLYLMLMGQG